MREIKDITIGIIARNEEKSIGKTLTSLFRAIDFLLEKRRLKINILVAVNATTDNTEAVVKDFFSNVKNDQISLNLYITHIAGKPNAINHIRNNSTTDSVIFMDADILVREDCIFNLIGGYEEGICKIASSVGMPRNIFYLNPVRAKLAIKMIEYATREGPMVDGTMYMINKNDFKDIPDGIINDDLYMAISAGVENINRVKGAVIFQEPVGRLKDYYHRKIRIESGDRQIKGIFGEDVYCRFSRDTKDRRSKRERKGRLPVLLRTYEKALFLIDIVFKIINRIVTRRLNSSKTVMKDGWYTQQSSKL